MLLSSAIEDYFLAHDYTPQTLRSARQRLTYFHAYLTAAMVENIEDVTRQHYRGFVPYIKLQKPSLSNQTLHNYMKVAKAFLFWCARDDLIEDKIIRNVSMPVLTKKIIAVFNKGEMDALLAACEEDEMQWLVKRNVAILMTLFDTGVRAAELCGLHLSDIHCTDKYIKVMGKGRKEREIGLSRVTGQALHKYITRYRPNSDSTALFLSKKTSEGITTVGLTRLFQRLSSRTGLLAVRCSPHTARHTYAVQYMELGGDVLKLSRLLGHANVSITETYLRQFGSTQARKNSLSVLDNWR